MVYCDYCKTPLDDDAKYCSNCGAPTQMQVRAETPVLTEIRDSPVDAVDMAVLRSVDFKK